MAACRYCGTPVGFGATRCNTETCYLQRINELKAALAERDRRIVDLEREHDHLQTQYKLVARREEELEDLATVLRAKGYRRDVAIRREMWNRLARHASGNEQQVVTYNWLQAFAPELISGEQLPQRPQDSDGSGREGKDPDSEP